MDTSSETKSNCFALIYTIGIHVVLFIFFLLIEFVNPGQSLAKSACPEPPDFVGYEISSRNNNEDASSKEIRSSIKSKAVVSQNKSDVTSRVTDANETVLNANKNSNYKEEDLQNALLKLGKIKGTRGNKNDNAVIGETKSITNVPEKNLIPGTPFTKIDLYGRMLIKRPEALNDSKEEGIVVVEIIVDETGNVIKAIPGQRGSTAASTTLFEKAKQIAIRAKFNRSSEGIKEQRGTYTFVFTLQ